MSNEKLAGRTIVQWKGIDPYEDLNSLADAITKAAQLFDHNGSLVLLHEGKLLPVGRDLLSEIITKFVVTQNLVNHGSDAEPNWQIQYQSFTPSEPIIRLLLTATDHKHGSLLARAAKVANTTLKPDIPRQMRLAMANPY